jgi:4-amino-4-deoxy-L-arabinose transferase-like glycosyltransferase
MDRSGRALTGALAAVLVLFLLAAGNGERGLLEPSEGRYGSIAAEMVRSGDWLVPRLNGVEHYEKPPLAIWAMAAALRLFGESEWALRLPGALAAGLAVLVAYLLAGDRGGRARWAALLTLGSPLFFALARVATTDIYLAASSALALLAATRSLEPGRREVRLLDLALLASVLGFLAKGPVIWILVLLPAVLEALWSRDRPRLRALFAPLRIVLFLALVAPWFLLVGWRTPGALGWFLGHRAIGAATSSEGFHGGSFFYYWPVLLLGALPAAWILAALGRAGLRELLAERRNRLLLLAVLAPFAFFSLSPSKLVTYALPLVVPLCALAGQALERGRGRAGVLVSSACLGSVALAALALGLARGWFARLPGAAEALFPAAAALALLASAGAAWRALHGFTRAGCGLLVGGQLASLLLLVPAVGRAEGELSRSGSGREIARALQDLAVDGRPILGYRCFVRSLPFYTGRRILLADFYEPDVTYQRDLAAVQVAGPEPLRSLLAAGPVAVFCRSGQVARLQQEAGPLRIEREIGRYTILSTVPGGFVAAPASENSSAH